MPEGGKRLYQGLRRDYEPVLIDVFIAEEIKRERLAAENALAFSREFDPVLYFWPVEDQHCVVHLWEKEPELIARLAFALLRDGALWVSFLVGGLSYEIQTWGDVDAFWRKRYGCEAPMGAVAASAGGG